MHNTDEEFIATLVHPDEYMLNLNRVTSVTSKNITFNKRKFVSKAGNELVKYPMTDCVSINHKDERPIITIVAGILLILLICAIFYMVISSWDTLEAGTRIPVGLLLLAAIYGVRWVFGSRRHKIVFNMNDGAKLVWISRSGDFKFKMASTQKIVDFAQSAGLLRSIN